MSRPHADYALDIWQAVRDAGEQGLSPAQVYAVAGDRAKHDTVERSLTRMRLFGYLRYVGKSRYGRWHVGPNTPGERVRKQQRPQSLQPAPQVPPPGVACSVFDLGAMTTGAKR